MSTRQERIGALEKQWAENPRWAGIERTYSAEEVIKLQGTVVIEQTLAKKVLLDYGIHYMRSRLLMHWGH